uniref:Uncharacterized protein n=1 Tax=Oryza punctata TaxID=4537 RepID=A0A0E0JQZ4_ORYPU
MAATTSSTPNPYCQVNVVALRPAPHGSMNLIHFVSPRRPLPVSHFAIAGSSPMTGSGRHRRVPPQRPAADPVSVPHFQLGQQHQPSQPTT